MLGFLLMTTDFNFWLQVLRTLLKSAYINYDYKRSSQVTRFFEKIVFRSRVRASARGKSLSGLW
jgi:hypothetical protein